MSETLRLILTIIQVVSCVGLILSVIFQSSQDEGGMSVLGGTAETFFGKNKSRSLDAKLEKATIIFSIAIAVLTICLTIF